MDVSYTQSRITKTRELIDAYEAALLAMGAAGGVNEYLIDTGQTRQRVTRADIPKVNAMLDSLYNRLATLQARIGDGGRATVRGGW